MTDLERVRDYIGKYAPNPTKAMHVLEDIDAHLKEDAEREDWHLAYTVARGDADAYKAELARLRDELDLKDGLLNQAKGELDRLREIVKSKIEGKKLLKAENARLREELHGYRNRKFKEDYVVENARLREEAEQLKEAISKLAVQRAEDGAELDRANDHFNEAVRERDDELTRLRERNDALAERSQAEFARRRTVEAENARYSELLDRAVQQHNRDILQRDILLTTLREIERGKYEGWILSPGGPGYRAAKRMSRKMMREHARVAIDDVNSREDE